MNPELFRKILAQKGLVLSETQAQQFAAYFRLLTTANQHVNLTRITAENDVYLKHFYDSLTPLLTFPQIFAGAINLCDVGAGAGFPSLPLKIARPNLQVSVVDSLAKRLRFLNAAVKKLGLTGVRLIHARAEDAGQDKRYRGRFDIVSARAVARMPVLCEYCLPLVKKGGFMLALKGPGVDAELSQARRAIKTLGGKLYQVKRLTLPESSEERTLVLVEKTNSTPKRYPRQAGTPHRKPLI